MAGHPDIEAFARPAPEKVGNEFVCQYYNILCGNQTSLYRFYADESRFTRVGADGLVETVVSQSEIDEKVRSYDYGRHLHVEMTTVDSQDSVAGGVLVTVTGALWSELRRRRNFVQNFFLAPRGPGYFIINDIFRYLDDEPEREIITSQRSAIHANGIPKAPQVDVVSEAELTLPIDLEVRETSSREVESTGEKSVEHVDVSETRVIDEPPPAIAIPAVPVPSQATSEETPKKSVASKASWASILKIANSGASVPFTTYRTVPKAVSSSTEQSAPNQDSPTTTSTGLKGLDKGAVIENEVDKRSLSTGLKGLDKGAVIQNEADGRSVYVKNLPVRAIPGATAFLLKKELQKFGVVKPGGVNIRGPQDSGVSYAFVEFAETASAQAAIKQSAISFDGRKVYIAKKKPRARGQGGRASGEELTSRGRGTGPVANRNDNFRGHSHNGVSSNGRAGAAAGGVDSTRRDSQGGNHSRATGRGVNQIATNGATLHANTPEVAAC